MLHSLYTNTSTIILLGDCSVGKSAILHRLTQSQFRSDCRATLGPEFSSFDTEIDCDFINLHLWDTAGDPRQPLLAPRVKHEANAYVIVFDVTDRQSFDNIDIWRKQFVTPGIPCIAFASKCDISESEREITISEARQSLHRRGIPLIEVSAKTGHNIEEGFRFVANQILQHQRRAIMPQTEPSSMRPACKCCCY
jgi:small GTP-binding protein